MSVTRAQRRLMLWGWAFAFALFDFGSAMAMVGADTMTVPTIIGCTALLVAISLAIWVAIAVGIFE